MNRRQPVFPGYCFFKGCGNLQQQGFFSESGNELDAHGQAGCALAQRKRDGRQPGSIGVVGKRIELSSPEYCI